MCTAESACRAMDSLPSLVAAEVEVLGERRRRVTFAEEPDAVISPRVMLTETLLRDTWYSPQDFQRFRSSAIMVASGIRNRDSGSSSDANCYTNTLAAVYASFCSKRSPDRETLCYLATWFNVGPTRRGLEFLSCSKSIRSDRKARIRIAIAKVLVAQANFDAEHIRKVYRQISAPARQFAIIMAKASDLASRQDVDSLRTAAGDNRKEERQRLPPRPRNQILQQKSTRSSFHQIPLHRAGHLQQRRAST